MNKKIIIGIISIAILGGAAWAGKFYWKDLRGAGPALLPAPTDIVQAIETSNTTGMPLKIPPGFTLSIFAKNLKGPRVLAFDPAGHVVVSLTSEGKVVALPDINADKTADNAVTVVQGLTKPHGIAFPCWLNERRTEQTCKLYIAEENKITVWDYDKNTMKASNGKRIAGLPSGGGHFTRTVLFMPAPNDQKLLVSIGSSCNVCREQDTRRATVMVMNADGSGTKAFATGLRNSVFMAIHPVTEKILATEMGRDLLGDDTPPDEVNILEEGKNYGWPECFGKNMHDKTTDEQRPHQHKRPHCAEPYTTASHIDIPAHSAPLGLAFVPEEGWPEDMWYNMLVAYHGSWNRTTPAGYKVVRYIMDATGNVKSVEDFITGWLTPDGALGRPVDILVQPGGRIYISDDKAGVIYLLTHL